VKAAFYKGTTGISGLVDIAIREWEEGDYSHVELLFNDGRSASSVLSNGVRFTKPGEIDFSDTTQWDVLDLPGVDEAAALTWFMKHAGQPYDVLGDLHFILGFISHENGHKFCSFACGAACGFEQAWRFDPNALYVALKRLCLGKAA
jgi:L-ascorbate metabolism protein UlaG (beta-lactamase superfamily)